MHKRESVGKSISFILIYFLVMVLQIPSAILYLINDKTPESFLLFFGYFILFIISILMYRKEIVENIKALKGKYLQLILFCILMIIFVLILSGTIAQFSKVTESNNQNAIDKTIIENAALVFFPIVIFGPFVEEILYRNILIGKLGNRFFKKKENIVKTEIIEENNLDEVEVYPAEELEEESIGKKVLKKIMAFIIVLFSIIIFSMMHTGFSKQILLYIPIALGLTIVYLKYDRNFIASFTFHLMWNSLSYIISILIK